MAPYIILSLIFIASGVALLSAIAYLAQLVRRHRRTLGMLLNLAKGGLDPLQLPAAAWPALLDGGIKQIEYSGNWFGQPIQGHFGATQIDADNRPFAFEILANDDIQLGFRLYARTNRGEARLFAENLSGVFRLLLETSVHSKMEALSAALTEQARLSLYLQHDLRNLAQWVSWLAADISVARDDEALLGVAQRLRTGAPHAAARATRILNATCKARTPQAIQAVLLTEVIKEATEHADIAVDIEGEARILLHRDLLDRALDNLFANVAPLLHEQADRVVSVTIGRKADKALAKITIPRLSNVAQIPAEKLFEPFASGRPGGLGLGLYQAHKSLMEAGGDLAAELQEHEISFLLTLPCSEHM